MNIYAHRVAIVGVTGYAGQELERLLASHPKIQIAGKFASKANEKSGAEAFSFERLRCFSADAVVLARNTSFRCSWCRHYLKPATVWSIRSGPFGWRTQHFSR